METRINGKRVDDVIRKTNFDYSYKVEARGFSDGIWLLWKEILMVDVMVVSNQFIHY